MIGVDVTAANRDVISIEHRSDQCGQNFGRMLQVSVDDTQQISVRMLPTVQYGARKTFLILANQQAYSWVCFRKAAHDFAGSIRAAIVHDCDFVSQWQGSERSLHPLHEKLNVSGFVQGGNDER